MFEFFERFIDTYTTVSQKFLFLKLQKKKQNQSIIIIQFSYLKQYVILSEFN